MRNLPFAQGGLNGFLQIPHEVSDSFYPPSPFLRYKDSPAVCNRKPTGRQLPIKQTLESLENVSSEDRRNKR